MTNLDGLTILIVESDARFLHEVRRALEKEGASTLAVSEPNSVAGAQRITRSIYSAAVINDWHRRIQLSLLNMLVLIYGGTAPTPALGDAIVRELKVLVGARS